jgi:hypothetical protein
MLATVRGAIAATGSGALFEQPARSIETPIVRARVRDIVNLPASVGT